VNFGQKILKLVSPKGEEIRQEFRMTLSHAQAATDDLHRTVLMDGERIKKAIEEMRCKTNT